MKKLVLSGFACAACSSLPTLGPPAKSAGACAAAHAVALKTCDAEAADPLVEPACADALRVAVRSCAERR